MQLVEETEQPERDDIVMANLEVVDSIEVLGVVLGANHPITYAETIPAIHQELYVSLVRLVQFVVLVQHVIEERLTQLTWLHVVEACGEQDIRVVHVNDGRLLRELLFTSVEHVDQTCFLEVRQIVHHRGTARLDALGQQADVW